MKAIIVDTNTDAIDGVRRKELLDWAVAQGVDTARATGQFVLVENERGWRACFSLKRRRDGRPSDFIDPNTGRLAVDYGSFRVDVIAGSWPHWFPAPLEMPEVSAGHLLDVLAAADQAASDLRSNIALAALVDGAEA